MAGLSGEIEAGTHIGDYILEARLGGGSFGTVWRAHHASTGQPVAIKLLTGVLAERDRTDMRAEVELLAATASSKSPHVVRVLGGGTEPVPYVVMEYIEGTDLASLLKERGKLSPQETIRIGLGVADALGALEEAGIIHRDVKPANVMLDREGTVKLTDFGIAKIVGYETITMTGQLPMTMAHVAPEAWEGGADHQSDLYALGILLYQCLVGSPPFTGNYGALYRQHTSVMPDLGVLPEETPPSLREVIRLCLQKEPGARPSDAASCLDLLERAQGELTEGSFAPVVREPERFGSWVKREVHPSQPLAWRCVHEATGEEAIVEVHFAHDLAYGAELRKAVAANPKLVPSGAERLLGTNRLLLRPGEGWCEPSEGEFSFWVAREELPSVAPPTAVSVAMLRRAVEGLLELIDAADTAGIPLSLAPENVDVLADGSVYVRRPGLPPGGESPPMDQALALVRSLPLDEEAQALVVSACDLRSLGGVLGALSEGAAGPSAPVPELGVAHPAEDTGLLSRPDIEEDTGTYAAPTAISAPPEPAALRPEEPVAEADVAAVPSGIVLKLEPARAGGRFGASYRVQLENRTQTRQSLRVRVDHPEEHCRYLLAATGVPPGPAQRVSLPPGGSETLHLRASASSSRLLGRREKRRFTVTALGGGSGLPPTANGEFDEIPYFSGWPPLAGGALLVVGIAALVMALVLGHGHAGSIPPSVTPTPTFTPSRGLKTPTRTPVAHGTTAPTPSKQTRTPPVAATAVSTGPTTTPPPIVVPLAPSLPAADTPTSVPPPLPPWYTPTPLPSPTHTRTPVPPPPTYTPTPLPPPTYTSTPIPPATDTLTPVPPPPPPTDTPTTVPPPPPPPAIVVVDDTDAGFTLGGPSGTCSSPGANDKNWYWCWQNGGYGGHYWYTWNNGPGNPYQDPNADVNWGTWRPNIPQASAYRVCAYIPEDHAYTKQARYRIYHAGGVTSVYVNQQPLSGWVDLGVFTFNAGTDGYVYLGDTTGENWGTNQIGFDAMKWVPNGGGC